MRAIRFCTATIACMSTLIANPHPCLGGPSVRAPEWKVGDSWVVRTWYPTVSLPRAKAGEQARTFVRKGREVLVSFSVAAMKEIEGQRCYEIEAVYPPAQTGSQHQYLLYFRSHAMRLVRVVDHSLKPDGSAVNSVARFAADARGPTFVSNEYTSAVPFDFPDLNSGDSENTDRNDYSLRQVITTRAGKNADGRACNEDEFVLTRTKEGTKYEEKTVLTWVEGDPWWRRAVKYKNGEIVNEAELVEFTADGKRRPVKPRQDEE